MGGNLFGMTTYVCSKCGRRADEFHIRGWLIGTHKDPERAYNGEMMIRCPDHITEYAIRNTVGGRNAIKG